MASKQKSNTATAATDDASGTSAATDVGATRRSPAPSASSEPAPAATAADTSGATEPSAKPKVCNDPLLFLFRLLSFFPSLFDTYYEPSQTTTTT